MGSKNFDSNFQPAVITGQEFKGARIDVLDRFNYTVVEGLQSEETRIKIENLPYFAHFTVKARALYGDGDELVESVEVTEEVGTGTEGSCHTQHTR